MQSFSHCCPRCHKTLSSGAALRQHCLGKHGWHICLVCGECLISQTALVQHSVMHARPLHCKIRGCGMSFASDRALEQHTASKHAFLPMPTAVRRSTSIFTAPHEHKDPFPGASGCWVPRIDFSGNKSFGRFKCGNKTCAKAWGSAHAFAEYEQGCQKCETMTHPCCMWVNNETDLRDFRDPNDDDNESRPHDIDRCEACRVGACRLSNC